MVIMELDLMTVAIMRMLVSTAILVIPSVKMEKYVWLVVLMTDQEELRYASMMCGEQYVMTCGIMMMLQWFVDNLVFQLLVRIIFTVAEAIVIMVCILSLQSLLLLDLVKEKA